MYVLRCVMVGEYALLGMGASASTIPYKLVNSNYAYHMGRK